MTQHEPEPFGDVMLDSINVTLFTCGFSLAAALSESLGTGHLGDGVALFVAFLCMFGALVYAVLTVVP